ncbi:hypothetical protein BDZ94DRAFT_1260403 [Collybia nuda]|uniref:Peptidase M20 dimerisation domain-containing protein n=1 Tax=Collybia nuda TaxID=64659 RepID=A0A9P5Y5X7_9AGAR|nr:hypothetical protein BDZ94DRAFT_1260403 [Collybia nuda]
MTTDTDYHDVLHHACSYTFHHGDPNDRWFLAGDAALSEVHANHIHEGLHLAKHTLLSRVLAAKPGAERDDIYRPEVMRTIEEEIDSFNDALRELNLKIHDTSEIKFKETFAHDTLTEFMEAQGFEVTRKFKSEVSSDETPQFMTTAWRAAWTNQNGTGAKRVLGVNSEMDALPIPRGEVNHGCGHNLIAIAGVAVALGVKKALKVHGLSGTVVLLGTPAEEGGHGKIRLIEAGAYKEMDACVMCHPGSGPKHEVIAGTDLAIQALRVTYKGKPAHAALAPWEGINAQDAVIQAYNAISMLRQQLKPDLRVHGVIHYDKQPLAVNVIPDHMEMIWDIRAPSKPDLDDLRRRVVACFEGAATATGCTATIICKTPLMNLNQSDVMAQDVFNTVRHRYGMSASIPDQPGAFSTDFGNVTYEMPAIHMGYSIPTPDAQSTNHTVGFIKACATQEAHDETIKVSKAIALTGFRVLDDDQFFGQASAAFKQTKT